MNKEEAIEFGNMWLQVNEDSPNSHTYKFFQKALKALEQEPCEDCVGRQAVLVAMRNNYRDGGRDIDGDYVEGNYSKKLYNAIISLPSVTPQPKTGHWVDKTMQSACGVIIYNIECSECGEPSGLSHTLAKYCPNCGAKMSEIPTD